MKLYSNSVSLFGALLHPCPEPCRAPDRFVKSKLSLNFVITWKSLKSYVRIRKKNRPFQGKKKSYGGSKVGFGTFFSKSKNAKIVCKTQYRLARISILDSYDSSVVKSSDDAKKISPHAWPLWNGGKRGKYCFVFGAHFLGGHGPQL